MERQAKAKTNEHSNHTVSACILVADMDLLAFVEKKPLWLFDQGARSIALKGMRLKLSQPSPPEKEVTGWCELIRQDEKLGYATPFLAQELKRAAGTEFKNYAASELRRLIPETIGEVANLVAELEGKPRP
jgi:hypothetical protein